MKVLLVVMKEQRALLDSFYDAIAANLNTCDIHRLDDNQQADLETYFSTYIDYSKYDRIVVFIRCKKAFAQRKFFRKIPNLVFLEHDISQNYSDCKYKGEFSRLYRTVPWCRVICSGAGHARRLRSEGFDASFVPKGYDPTLIRNFHRPRSIELAFVGSIKNSLYRQRKRLLEQIARVEPLEIVRTASGEEYAEKLNAIRFFVSADTGFGEYMIKNFEAMAAGCILLAYDQGAEENDALGFKDMHNVVFYRDVTSLRQKLMLLRTNAELADTIAANGQRLVEDHFTWNLISKQVVEALLPPLRERVRPTSWLERLRQRFNISTF